MLAALKIKDAGKFIFIGLLSYIAFLPILLLMLIVVVIISAIFNYHPEQQMLFKVFIQEENLWLLIYSTLMVVVFGPIVEEVFFRGFAYNALKKKWGVKSACFITAAVFAGLHGTLAGFFPIMGLGLLLVYVYEKTDSLVPSIMIHVLHNGLMISFLFIGRYFIQLDQ